MTQKNQPQILTVQQAQTLIKAAKGHDLEELFTFALATGMRRGELLALRWQDIDLVSGKVHIRRTMSTEERPVDSRHQRILVLPALLLSLLSEYHLRQPELRIQTEQPSQGDGLVFCNNKGQALRPLQVRNALSLLLQQAQLSPLRFHDLRYSTISILITMVVPIQVIEALFGFNRVNTAVATSFPVPADLQTDALEKLCHLLLEGSSRGQE